MKSATMFTLAQRFERGEDIEPQIRWALDVGANCLDVFAQFCFMNWPEPKRDPFIATPETILALSRYLASRGIRVNWRMLADCQEFGDDNGAPIPALNMPHDQQVARVRDVIDVLRHEPNVTLCIANEPPFNGVDIWRVIDDLGLRDKRNRPMLMDSGEYHETVTSFTFPVLDIYGDHPKRKPEYPAEAAKTGHFMREGWSPDHDSPSGFLGFKHYADPNIAFYTAEPQKYGETAHDGGDSADPSVTNAEQAGGGWGVSASGACFHSVDGIRSRVPGPNQTACAKAFFAAMDFSPVDAYAGEYSHDGYDSWPLERTTAAMEVAGRIMPDGTVYGVCALPEPAWNPQAKPGKTILDRKGDGGTLLRMR